MTNKVLPFRTNSAPDKIIQLDRAPMTATTQRVLNFIRDYINANGYPPSYREIASANYMTVSNVPRYLAHLESRGYITRGTNQPRSIRLCEPLAGYEAALWTALADLVKGARDLTGSDTAKRIQANRALERAARLLELRDEFRPVA